MAELNEYLTHYSNITFDEYKKLKASANENWRIQNEIY
jgi:hypothetical protein